MDNKNRSQINFIKFQGYTGGFAQRKSTMYKIDIVGVNGVTQQVSVPNTSLKESWAIANHWAALTGWTIVEFQEVDVVHTEVRKIEKPLISPD